MYNKEKKTKKTHAHTHMGETRHLASFLILLNLKCMSNYKIITSFLRFQFL